MNAATPSNRPCVSLHSTRLHRLAFSALALLCCMSLAAPAPADDTSPEEVKKKLPDFGQVQAVVNKHFASLPDRRPQDVISQGDVQPIFAQLAKIGWKVADQNQITKQILNDGDFLVGELRSEKGRELMRKTGGQTIIYDRLDRISHVYGGKQLIRDLVKLPDAEKYTKQNTVRGNPDLLDLLPKQGGGKTRTIKDYEKPTGRIYTAQQFMAKLSESYAAARKAAETTP